MPRTSNTIIRRKDGRYEARGMFGEPGRRRRRSFFGATADEARQKLTRALAQQDSGLTPPPERASVAVYLRAWLAAKAPDLRPESYRRYRDTVELHLVPTIGRHKLARLSATQVEGAYGAMRAKGLSGTSVQLVHGVLRKALHDAMRRGEVARNVCDMIDAPRRSTPETRPLTADEAQRLLEAAAGDELEAFYVVALTTGLRLGELQALRWRDLDLDGARLRVTATLAGVRDGAPILAPPKTSRSRREVHLSAVAVDALRQHRARQLAHRLAVGPIWEDHGLVFCNGRGRALDANNVRERSFRRLLERAGLPPMRFHELRHAAASLLLAQGVGPKVIAEVLGHADVTVTLRVYAHLMPSAQQEAAAAMDRLFATR